MADEESTDPTGSDTEAYVSSLYRSLGYHVQRDLLIQGSQIDILARKPIAGLTDGVTVVVEAKYRSSGSIGKDEVLAFANVARSLIGREGITHATMVSTVPFTKTAKETISRDQGIALLTVAELERALFDATESLTLWQQRRRESELGGRYIDLRLTPKEDHTRTRKLDAARPVRSSALLEIVEADPAGALILLADYGAGKSTTIERMKDIAADNYLKDKNSRVPVLFLLKEVRDDLDLSTFIEQTLRRELGRTLPLEAFHDALRASRFLILLDGFDEISLKSDRRSRAEWIQRLGPLLYSESPAVLTSRPSYFLNASEYRSALAARNSSYKRSPGAARRGAKDHRGSSQRLSEFVDSMMPSFIADPAGGTPVVDFSIYELELLDEQEIHYYLESHSEEFAALGVSAADVGTFLSTVYDLSDQSSARSSYAWQCKPFCAAPSTSEIGRSSSDLLTCTSHTRH